MAKGRASQEACVNSDATIVRLLASLERLRPLNTDERALQLSAKARAGGKRLRWHWTPAEMREIDMLIAKRARVGRPKPFRVDNEVRDMAARFGRTYMAVHRMIERRRKAAKCSSAASSDER